MVSKSSAREYTNERTTPCELYVTVYTGGCVTGGSN